MSAPSLLVRGFGLIWQGDVYLLLFSPSLAGTIEVQTKRFTRISNRLTQITMKKQGLVYGEITYKVRGCIFSVYNELGYGHKEQVYQKALAKEFNEMNILYKQEVDLNVCYKGEAVGHYRPDFVVEDKVIIEIKAVEFLQKTFETQLLHYLKTTNFNLGLLVNFGAPRLTIKRLIWGTVNQ